MHKRVLIDMVKLRELESCKMEAIDRHVLHSKSFKTIRELATFYFTCRRCEEAPCISVCPADALEKDENGMISRALNLCIRCKSCISICPFGTIMNDLFATKTNGYHYFDLTDDTELIQFANAFDDDIVKIVEFDEKPEEHIYRLTDRVLIRDVYWEVR
ncbi:hypothetical protein DMA11_03440 [Marinilabiliaceae bacterium JC017]|nr:hypothetical protein DMA11_03440 [Marinilabiliaceae bacterium JC017]